METMTVREVLEMTMKNLGEIAVPRSLNTQIGIPIDGAINNIQLCIEAMDKADDVSKATEDTSENAVEDTDYGNE